MNLPATSKAHQVFASVRPVSPVGTTLHLDIAQKNGARLSNDRANRHMRHTDRTADLAVGFAAIPCSSHDPLQQQGLPNWQMPARDYLGVLEVDEQAVLHRCF
jgi:hypothetical protein